MNIKMISIILFLILFTLPVFTETSNVVNDPRVIVIKPKAKNSLLLFMVNYNKDDFRSMVSKAMSNGTYDKDFNKLGINDKYFFYYLEKWDSLANSWDCFRSRDGQMFYYNESISATIRNLDSKQVFQVYIIPFMRRAYVPNITIGRYKFEKFTFSISIINNLLGYGSFKTFDNDVYINQELPEFTVNSNTAFLYGIVDFKGGEIKVTNEEKRMNKLRKYLALVKKFKKNANMKVVELNPDEYYASLKKESSDETAKTDSPNAKLTILNMLKEGKITPEQAEKLLNALKQ